MTDEIMAFDVSRTNNSLLMIDCAELGFLSGPGPLIDVTFNEGKFWRDGASGLAPSKECRFDIDPKFGVRVADFRNLPFPDGEVGVEILDPRYKLNGTSTGVGPSNLDKDYGVVGDYMSVKEIHGMIFEGIDEASRVVAPQGYLLLKCQAQQNASTLHDQPGMFASYAKASKLWKVLGFMHVLGGHRPQPGVQRTPRSNYSTLVVLQRTGKRIE